MIAQGHVAVKTARVGRQTAAPPSFGAQAADRASETWRCFATCVRQAIRGQHDAAYRLAVGVIDMR